MPLAELKVAAQADEGFVEDDGCSQSWNITNNTNFMSSPATSPELYHFYWRFTNVDIPQGSRIVSAVLYCFFEANGRRSKFFSDYDVYGEDADDSAAVTMYSNGPQSRTWTTAVTNNTPQSPYGAYGPLNQPAIRSNFADVTEIIQEIVDRAGWQAGNALMLICNDPNGCFQFNKSSIYSWGSVPVPAPYGNGAAGDEAAELDIEFVAHEGEIHTHLGSDML